MQRHSRPKLVLSPTYETFSGISKIGEEEDRGAEATFPARGANISELIEK